MKPWNTINELCDLVRESSFSLHRFLRSGHLEKVYENGLANRLRKLGLSVEQQHPLKVRDEDGTILGDTNNVKLRFDPSFMQMAVDGAL